MKYKLLSVVLLTGLLGTLAYNYEPTYNSMDSLTDMAPRQMHSTEKEEYSSLVRLRVKGKPHCSGVVIAHNYVLTAGHCVFGLLGKEIEVNPGSKIEVTIKAKGAAYNMRQDYGVVVGDFSKFVLSPVDPIQPGLFRASPDAILGVGFAGGASKYTMTKLIPVAYAMFSLIATGQVYPGMSGGPVVNANTGEVIGVLSATYDMGNGNYGTEISTLIGLYGSLGIEKEAE